MLQHLTACSIEKQTLIHGGHVIAHVGNPTGSCLLQVRGKMACLLINDIDAGLGHFANTQVQTDLKLDSHV